MNGQYEQLGEPAVTLEDIKRFRQLESKCPGHPEYRWTSVIETTTGPLGQGVALGSRAECLYGSSESGGLFRH